MVRLSVAAALLCAAPFTVLAQQALPADIAERTQAVRAAEETARQMTESQRASMVAQRQYAGMVGGEPGANYRGAVAHPGTDLGVWQVVIVGQQGNAPDALLVALAVYEVSGDAVLGETIYPAAEVLRLSGDALFMARARREAPRAVLALPDTSFCVDDDAADGGSPSVSFATIVMPPRADGTFDAYVLNGPIQPGAFPLGKHFRVPFDQFGIAGEPVLLTDTCEVVTWDEADPQLAQRVYLTDFVGGDAPNEIYPFVSAQVPLRLGVTAGGVLWPMAQGMIAPPQPVPDRAD